MEFRASVMAATATLLCGCAAEPTRRPEFSGGYPVYDCPEQLEGQVRLSADVYPLARPSPGRDYSLPTVGEVGRRLVIGVDPAGLDRRDRIVWSSLAVSSYGGTFTQWSRLQTDHVVIDPMQESKAGSSAEVTTVKGAPGQIRITRSARSATDLAGTHTLDVTVMPGGVVIDDTVLAGMQLWKPDGTPLSPADARFNLSPVRHPPGLDVVQASLQLDYVVRVGASGEEWACSAEARVTLVDRDALRQAFWDLGLAWKNASRRESLALYSAELGAVRLTFDSPAAANSFANWLQVTQATEVGGYAIGAFTQDLKAGRPFGPVDAEAMRTYRPLRPEDFAVIKVRAVGEF